jgi:hypothetical protein
MKTSRAGQAVLTRPAFRRRRRTRAKPQFHGWRIGRLGTIFASQSPHILEYPEPPMGEVVRFVPKSELERARLIREARANYERIFPPADPAGERREPDK